MADRNANIVIGLKNLADPELRKLAGSFRDLTGETQIASANFDKLEQQFQQLQQSEIRAATATGQYGRALALIDSEMNAAGQGTIRYNNLLVQQAQIQQKAEQAALRAAKTQQQGMDSLRSSLAPVNTQLQGGTDLAQQFGSAFKSSLAGLLGPAALVTAGFQLVTQAVHETEEAFQLKATIDQNNASIAIQLQGVRDTAVAFSQAQNYANRYKLTQSETSEAIAAAIPVIRTSRASLEDILGVFDRLRVKQPGKTFGDAARALGELQAGQVVSLEHIFNVLPDDANRMKDAIRAGADPVKVLSDYLDKAGIGMDALSVRTQGAAGKMNELKVETENFQLALGGGAGGIGQGLLDAKIAQLKGQTRVFSGDLSDIKVAATNAASGFNPLIAILNRYGISVFNSTAATERQTAAAQQQAPAILRAADADDRAAAASFRHSEGTFRAADADDRIAASAQSATAQMDRFIAGLQQSAEASVLDTAKKDAQQAKTALVSAQAKQTADAFLKLNPSISASAAASLAAAQGYDSQIQKLVSLQIEANNARDALGRLNLAAGIAAGAANLDKSRFALGGASGTNASVLAGLAKGQGVASAQVGRENQLFDLQIQNRLINAKTSAERIAILKQELAGTTDILERQRLQNQIDQERNSAAKHHTSELNKQLNLEERIRDSKEAQFKASLDIQKLTAQDVLDRLKEAREARTANNILNSSRASAEFKQAAAARLSIIDADQKLRALDIAEKQKTVGGTIINGRVFQSRPAAGGAPVPSVPTPGGAGAPQVPSVPTPGGAGGGGAVTINLNVNGHTIATEIIPDVLQALRSGQRQANSAGGGTG